MCGKWGSGDEESDGVRQKRLHRGVKENDFRLPGFKGEILMFDYMIFFDIIVLFLTFSFYFIVDKLLLRVRTLRPHDGSVLMFTSFFVRKSDSWLLFYLFVGNRDFFYVNIH